MRWLKKGKNGSLVLIAVMVLFIIGLAVQAYASAYLKNSFARFGATAGHALSIGDVVCLKDADGYAYKADADNATLRPAVGIVTKAGAAGESVSIMTLGIFGGYSGLTEGAPVYLSGTAGTATQTAPSGYLQQVGIAISATSYLFDFKASAVNECVATHDFDNETDAWNLTAAEAGCQYLYASNAGGAVTARIPAAYPGRIWAISNQTGQVLTIAVPAADSNGTIASTKTAIYVGSATGAVEIYEKP